MVFEFVIFEMNNKKHRHTDTYTMLIIQLLTLEQFAIHTYSASEAGEMAGPTVRAEGTCVVQEKSNVKLT